MAVTGFIITSNGTDGLGAGDNAWTNTSNIEADDASEAQASLTAGLTTKQLDADQFDFSGSPIGDTDIITDVTVRIDHRKAGGGQCTDLFVQLLIAGTPSGDNQADQVTQWSTTAADVDYTGTWGLSLTGADVKLSTFGVMLRARHDAGGGVQARCDAIEIQVTFEAAGGGGNPGAGSLMSGGVGW